jgi:hypothetical protein
MSAPKYNAVATYATALSTLESVRLRQEYREEQARALGFMPVVERESADTDERVRRAYYEFNPELGSTLLYALKERAAEEEMQKERTV